MPFTKARFLLFSATWILLANAAFIVTAQAQTPAQLQKTLQADYNAQDAAFARNDPQGTTAYFAEDFMVRNQTTDHTTRNALALQRAAVKEIHQLAPKSATAHTDIKRLTLNPAKNAADVVIQTRYVAVAVNPHTHKAMTIVISGVYQENWAKRPEGWRITEQRKISSRTTAT